MECKKCLYFNRIRKKEGMAVCERHSIPVAGDSVGCLEHVYCDNPEKDWENKNLILLRLHQLLVTTRAGSDIKGMILVRDPDHVLIGWENGTIQEISVEAESGLQIIKDVLKAIS